MKRKAYDRQEHRKAIFQESTNEIHPNQKPDIDMCYESLPVTKKYRKDRVRKTITVSIEQGHNKRHWYLCIDGVRVNDDLAICADTLEDAILKIRKFKIRLPYEESSSGIKTLIIDGLLF